MITMKSSIRERKKDRVLILGLHRKYCDLYIYSKASWYSLTNGINLSFLNSLKATISLNKYNKKKTPLIIMTTIVTTAGNGKQ
jgi:hypothetical protein